MVGGLSMVVVTDLKKVKKGPKDKTAGKDVYEGTTGFTKENAVKGDITKPNPFVAKQKDSPDYMDFYRESTTFGVMAPLSQQKFDDLATSFGKGLAHLSPEERVDIARKMIDEGYNS